MSKDFYFNKWKETLKRLKELVDSDIENQVAKTHDATLSEAVLRLSAMLGKYILTYNEAIECAQQNLQVQKTVYMDNVVKAIVSRILELKNELTKLEGSNFQFIGYGLIEVHHTIFDIEMTTIPLEVRRPELIQNSLEDILATAKEKRTALELIANTVEDTEETSEIVDNWWEVDEKKEEEKPIEKEKDSVPEEIRKTREYLAMIMAQEKTRQVTRSMVVNNLKRTRWEKELTGQLTPARYEVREKGAKLIQEVFRAYFELKREHIKTCKRDELLGLNICENKKIDTQRRNAEEMLRNRPKLHEIYEKEWIKHREELKEGFLRTRREQLLEENRDQIREWFVEWFESVLFFHDIPKDGSVGIFKGEVPDPNEWLEENNALLLQKAANKKKNPQDLKYEKQEAKRQAMLLKKEGQMKIKADAQLLKKMMKNPTMHPGFNYPPSKRTEDLIDVINKYHRFWDVYDETDNWDVKVKYVHKVNIEDAIMEAKLEILPEVDEPMRKELHHLKQALKEDYKRNELEMPVDVTKPIKDEKKKKGLKATLTEQIAEKIENLAVRGFIVEYPRTKIEDFIGDANFGGEDLRAQIQPAYPFNFEIRAYWWERCREVCLGFHRILLVGPKDSGKTVLVQAMASINDAVLFELDPYKVQEGLLSSALSLKLLINDVVACAKAVQPSVIHIKYIQKLFYTKTPPEEAEMNLGLIKTFFVQKLFKKINNTDNITVIGTCSDPWLAKSSMMLKQFPVVLLLPDNTYSMVVQMLKEWVVKHNVIPADFNVTNLAKVLQGYTFGYLKEILDKFMSADRIAKIAAFGISPLEVYNFILDDENGTKIEYDKYLKWYTEQTISGKKEMQHLEEQKAFKAAVEKYTAKNKKKAKSAPGSTTASYTGV